MESFFAWKYTGAPFELFGRAHIAGLFSLPLLGLSLLPFKYSSETTRARVRLFLAICIWVNELAWHLWIYYHGQWSVQWMLPLQICSVMIWLSGVMLITRNFRIYEFAYFLGIGGAIHLLATPDLGIYGFPHFRFWQTFLSHGLLIISAVFMTVVEGFRPSWRSMLRAALWMNVYMLIIYFVNRALGSNYLMINGKTNTPSLLHVLPDWPWYILWLEGIGIITFIILYSPFIIKDSKMNRVI